MHGNALSRRKFEPSELKKIETIRLITQDCHKDLGKLLDDFSGTQARIPIFGYPLVCYSPVADELADEPNAKRYYDSQFDSLWQYLSRSICSGAKPNAQLLIRDLLDSHDEQKEKEEATLKRFTHGISPKKHTDM